MKHKQIKATPDCSQEDYAGIFGQREKHMYYLLFTEPTFIYFKVRAVIYFLHKVLVIDVSPSISKFQFISHTISPMWPRLAATSF